MSIQVTCYFCNQELNENGALLFSPPIKLTGVCDKFHICQKCFKTIISVKEDMDKIKLEKLNKEKK